MNKHLNLFRFYTPEDRTYQLENDLTRALAICLQEDNLLLHEVLRHILGYKESYYDNLFDDLEGKKEIRVDIQKRIDSIESVEHLFAVSLSEHPLATEIFFNQTKKRNDKLICDLVITIDNAVIIVETKRGNENCIVQLHKQAYNIFENQKIGEEDFSFKEWVSPIDLNWPKLMEIIIKVASFQNATGNQSRFCADFIQLVKKHNHKWLPEPSISSLSPENKSSILRRIESAVLDTDIPSLDKDRLGFSFRKSWADEFLLKVDHNGNLIVAIYPANTKGQGRSLFHKNGEPVFENQINIFDKSFELRKSYHIKFTSFQKYFTGLWFKEADIQKPLHTYTIFNKYSGRKKRGTEWENLQKLFDDTFKPEYNWKEKCQWDKKIEKSGRNQFDISFGYELHISVPFVQLKALDTKKDNLDELKKFLKEAYYNFHNVLIA